MNLSDLKIGQTMQRKDLSCPFVGRVVGLDFVGTNGKPCVLLKSDGGVVVRVTNSELDRWTVLKAEK